MSISLRNVHVLVPAGSPDAELVAQRCSDAGAIVTTSAAGVAASEIDWSTVALVVLPGQTPGAAELIAAAEERGVPVNNLGGGTEESQNAGDRDGDRPGAGTVTLVGGGPGGEGLITVAGKRAIQSADIIFADHLGPFGLAEEAAERGAELVDVSKIPYGKQVAQEKTNEMLIEAAQQGKKVVRLKGGDPFIFGRGLEEAEACAAAGVPVSVIPGVTSATSAPALAGVSLTHRGWVHDITIVSGHVPPGHEKSLVNWEAVAGLTGTLVLIMAVKNAGAIFLGAYSSEPLGDYFAGPNHVLPTSGTARFFSPLSVDSFVKKSSFISYTRDALLPAADDIIRLAEAEGLTAHANSVRVRKEGE